MAVALKNLYQEICTTYDVQLQTESCFDKQIRWLHLIENIEFAYLLHGDELIFNSSLNFESGDIRKDFIDKLIEADASGLIVSIQEGHDFSQELIDYCNKMEFPLITASWDTPYVNITHRFSEILITTERKEMNLIAALKNVISHPQDVSQYYNIFEENGFESDMDYTIAIFNISENNSVYSIEKKWKYYVKQSVIYREKDTLVILSAGHSAEYLKGAFSELCQSYPDIRLGVGTTENQLAHLHHSYKNARIAFHLSDGIIPAPLLYYDELGVYQILTDMREPSVICPAFVRDTLGKLIEYDKEHKTKYMTVLKDFFENDCSITQTANATFYHQNTLKYKVKNIKEILGYDITSNENRVKIMLSLYMLKIAEYISATKKDD